MKPASYLAALAALPIEAVNLWIFLHTPLDVGFPTGTSIWIRAAAFESSILHMPALALYVWLDSRGIQSGGLFAALSICSGYIDTFLLLLAMIHLLRWLRSLVSPSGNSAQI